MKKEREIHEGGRKKEREMQEESEMKEERGIHEEDKKIREGDAGKGGGERRDGDT